MGQAIARAHRYGQTKEVLVVRLLSLSVVEEHMEEVQKEKLELEKKIIGCGGFQGQAAKTTEERSELLRRLLASKNSESVTRGATPPCRLNAAISRFPEEASGYTEIDSSLGITDAEWNSKGAVEALIQTGRLMSPAAVPEGFELIEDSDSE